MATKVIKQFEIKGRRFEAVSFVNEGEISVDGDEMLRRVPGAIGEEDEVFLREHRAELPVELRPYWLVTNRRDPGASRYVSCFDWDDANERWCQDWYWLDDQWYDYCLVVRRCT